MYFKWLDTWQNCTKIRHVQQNLSKSLNRSNLYFSKCSHSGNYKDLQSIHHVPRPTIQWAPFIFENRNLGERTLQISNRDDTLIQLYLAQNIFVIP